MVLTRIGLRDCEESLLGSLGLPGTRLFKGVESWRLDAVRSFQMQVMGSISLRLQCLVSTLCTVLSEGPLWLNVSFMVGFMLSGNTASLSSG